MQVERSLKVVEIVALGKPDHPLAHAFHLMMVNDLRHLPVVDDAGCPAGIVNSRELIEYLAKLLME